MADYGYNKYQAPDTPEEIAYQKRELKVQPKLLKKIMKLQEKKYGYSDFHTALASISYNMYENYNRITNKYSEPTKVRGINYEAYEALCDGASFDHINIKIPPAYKIVIQTYRNGILVPTVMENEYEGEKYLGHFDLREMYESDQDCWVDELPVKGDK